MGDYNEKIIAGLRRVMKESKISLRRLSEKTGIPYRSLQNYLSGQNRMPADVYVQLCDELGVDNQYIMRGSFHLQYFHLFDALWVSLGNSLLDTEYKPDTPFYEDMELHNKKQAAAASLATRISDAYNREVTEWVAKGYGARLPTYKEIMEKHTVKTKGPQ